MGERTNIHLINDGIYLYSHWDCAEALKEVLKEALIRGQDRWTDKQYLNRIICARTISITILPLVR